MINEDSRITLPDAPKELLGRSVAAWFEPVNIDTYDALPPSPYPAYLDRRVYQGSSGRVYPMPFFERIADEKHPRLWDAIHLENEYVRLMIIPSLGGRIHHATDKKSGYNFFYKNNVMKPALVGVLGPWISGGVEFNWPQHHRPATYLPTDWEIEENSDGSVTVWCADHDPFARMKGMHGITLHPDSAIIELSAKLTNRTDDVQTFLWWSNVAAEVHDEYQAFFPTDMRVVADHAKRAITGYPNATVPYYGIDYPSRVDKDHPDADRIDWYRNIPVPTSYMCLGTEDNFFGGYDHREHAGFVYWADRHIAPGKKLWTWGNSDFGHAWDKNLTDTEGPYIELMAGAYTDNQPDFSFLLPGETKTFSQFWYPIQEIGVVHQANLDVAVHLDRNAAESRLLDVGVAATRVLERASVQLSASGETLWKWEGLLAPGKPLSTQAEVLSDTPLSNLRLDVFSDGKLLLSWQPRPEKDNTELPPLAQPAPFPEDISTNEELYFAGSHLEQYRHPTRGADQYFEEALRRDPFDVRSGVALAARKWRRRELNEAHDLLKRVLQRVTFRNPNPYDSEVYYRLGLVLRDLGENSAAISAFRKATWDSKWKVASLLQASRLELREGFTQRALDDAQMILRHDTGNQQAAALAALARRRLGMDWKGLLREALDHDRLNWWVLDLLGKEITTDAQTVVDIALEYMSCGEYRDAQRLFMKAVEEERDRPILGNPTVTALAYYYLAYCEAASADILTEEYLTQAREADTTWTFPGRRSDAAVLEWASERAPRDAVARRLLGHWLYGVDRHQAAWRAWNSAVTIRDDDPITRRNLGIAAVNIHNDLQTATEQFERALELSPDDAKLWQERDQLAYISGEAASQRLARLDRVKYLVNDRDDLTVAYAELLTLCGKANEALELLSGRHFHPWEGGEGKVLRAWENANLYLARSALAQASKTAGEDNHELLEQALTYVKSAVDTPKNLGEARHPLANQAELLYAFGEVYKAMGLRKQAEEYWKQAAQQNGDFLDMAVSEYSIKSIFQALALERLGKTPESKELLEKIVTYADKLGSTPGQIPYFATSLPTMLLFHTNLDQNNRIEAAKLLAWARALLGDAIRATEHLTFLKHSVPSDPEVVLVDKAVSATT